MKKMLVFGVLIVSLLFLVSCVPASESETSELVAGQAITSDLVTCNKNIICKSAYNKCVTTTCVKITNKKEKAACADNCLKQAKLLIKKTSTPPTPSLPPAQDQNSGASSTAPTCSSVNLPACTTESSCRGIGMSWCVNTSSANGGYCSVSACPSTASHSPSKWNPPASDATGACRFHCDQYISSDPQYFNWCKDICDGRRSRTETCIDGVRNNNETGVDCGGPYCSSCSVSSTSPGTPATCSNRMMDGDERGIDCGGTCPLFCKWNPPASDATGACRFHCDQYISSDPQYFNWCKDICDGRRSRTETCIDGVRNNNETRVDCGGPYCNHCSVSSTSPGTP